MSSPGIETIDTEPLVIRTNDDSIRNTYVVARFDYPISSNYVLVTSTIGQLVPSDSIYVSSLTTSSIVSYTNTTDQCATWTATIGSASATTLALSTLSTGILTGCMQTAQTLQGDTLDLSTATVGAPRPTEFYFSTLMTSSFTLPNTRLTDLYFTSYPTYPLVAPDWIVSSLWITSSLTSTLSYQEGVGDLILLSSAKASSIRIECSLFSTMNGIRMDTMRTISRAVGSTPAYLMDLAGSINFTGSLYQHGLPYVPNVINLNPWISAPPSLYYSTGNVGIQTAAVSYPLTSLGTSRFAIPSQASTTSSLVGYSTSLLVYSTSLTNYNSTMLAYQTAQSIYVNAYQSTTTGYNISVGAYQTAQAAYTVAYQSTLTGSTIIGNAYQSTFLAYQIAFNSTSVGDSAAWAAYNQAYAQWSALPASNFGGGFQPSTIGTGGFPYGVAVSSDGLIQTVSMQSDGTTPNQIWTSTDTGSTWTVDSAPDDAFGLVCMDPTGQYQGCIAANNLYVSLDSGPTWALFPGAPSGYATGVSIGPSAVFYVCYYGGMIYRTTSLIPDGITVDSAFLPDLAGNVDNFVCVCSSRVNANVAFACADNLIGNGRMYSIVASSSAGATWAILGTAPDHQDYSYICCSDSGQYIAACTNNGQQSGSIYYSLNAGVTWNTANVPQLSWTSITCNGTGQYQLASAGTDGFIYFSVDYGANWTVSNDVPSLPWGIIALSQNALQGVALNSSANVAYESTTTVLQGPGPEPVPPVEPTYPIEPDPPAEIYYPDPPVAPFPPTYPTPPVAPSLLPPVPPTEPNPNPSAVIINGRMGVGTTTPNAPLQVVGTLKGTTKNFNIPHPLLEKRLLHSCVEGPRIDLLYRGMTTLVNGVAHVNLQTDSVSHPECAMTDGTFVALAARSTYYLQNMTGFDGVLGSMEGGTLTIRCENLESTDTISWMVVGERIDPLVMEMSHTNEAGSLITEY